MCKREERGEGSERWRGGAKKWFITLIPVHTNPKWYLLKWFHFDKILVILFVAHLYRDTQQQPTPASSTADSSCQELCPTSPFLPHSTLHMDHCHTSRQTPKHNPQVRHHIRGCKTQRMDCCCKTSFEKDPQHSQRIPPAETATVTDPRIQNEALRTTSTAQYTTMCACVFPCACVCACVFPCVCVCVHVYFRVCVWSERKTQVDEEECFHRLYTILRASISKFMANCAIVMCFILVKYNYKNSWTSYFFKKLNKRAKYLFSIEI